MARTWKGQTPEERKLLNQQRDAVRKAKQQVWHLKRKLARKQAVIEALTDSLIRKK